jgi:glucose/arabinose dehydrogenase
MATLAVLTRRAIASLLLVALLAGACDDDGGSSSAAPAGDSALPAPEVVATGIEAPWGLAFLPGGEALVAERDTGRILQVVAGQPPRQVMQLANVEPSGEAGLLGLAVSPNYAADQLVYAYYTAANGNRIVRFRLGGAEEMVREGIAKATLHDGGRLAFGPDGMLYATTGDATNPATAQDRNSLNGKILRMRPDGSPPPDNPFPGSVVYSYGHRNVQGIAWDPSRRVWASELGANSRDELNLIRPGANYGWPAVEGQGTGGGFTNPVVTWSTTEASPSGLAHWRGALYLAALRGERLWRVPVDGQGKTGAPESLLQGTYGRLRTVAVAPDGSLWVATSNRDGRGRVRQGDDRILRFRAP